MSWRVIEEKKESQCQLLDPTPFYSSRLIHTYTQMHTHTREHTHALHKKEEKKREEKPSPSGAHCNPNIPEAEPGRP